MYCPLCQSKLETKTTKTKTNPEALILYCQNCAGHWFPRWLANDISPSEANSLEKNLPQQSSFNQPAFLRCPECQQRLSLIKDDSVPNYTHIYTCPQGHGNFFPHLELSKFKKAQEAKINYLELWGVPVKSIFSVLLPVLLIVFTAAAIPLTLKETQTTKENRTKANEFFQTPVFTKVPPDSIAISFQTYTPGSSSISLLKDKQLLRTIDVSLTPKTSHNLVINNLDKESNYSIIISLSVDDNTIKSLEYDLPKFEN